MRGTLSLLLLLGLVLPGTIGCGKPGKRPAQERAKKPNPWKKAKKAGIDEDKPLEGTNRWRKTVLTRLYDLPAGRVNFHADEFHVKPFSQTEDIYIVAWRSNTENADGSRAPDDIHCHSFLADQMPRQTDAWLFAGIYTDGFTPELTMPEGFGILVKAGQRSRFLPMFNNRRNGDREARMRVEIDYVKASEAAGLRPLRAYTLSSARPDTYFVQAREPGTAFFKDVKKRDCEIPATGRVHAIGAHLHPYGRYVELRRKRDGKVIWRSQMKEAERLEDQRLTKYESTEGIFLRKGERCEIITVYENYTDKEIDAMGGLFLFFDPEGTE